MTKWARHLSPLKKNVDDAAAYLRKKGVCVIDGLYGVSMGGAGADEVIRKR